MTINEVVLVSACRTPIGRFMGSLKDIIFTQDIPAYLKQVCFF